MQTFAADYHDILTVHVIVDLYHNLSITKPPYGKIFEGEMLIKTQPITYPYN